MDKVKQWVALAVVAVVAVLAAGWFLAIAPKHGEARDLRDQAEQKARVTTQLRTKLAMFKAQAADLPREQAKLAAVATKLPDNLAEPALLRALAAAADGADVEFVSITPGTTVPLQSGSTSAAGVAAGVTAKPTTGGTATSTVATPVAGSSAAGASAGNLLSMPITISAAGGYYQLEQYLAALEDLPRALRITSLAIVNGADPVAPASATATATTDGQHLTAAITAQVYVLSGTAPATAVVAPAASNVK